MEIRKRTERTGASGEEPNSVKHHPSIKKVFEGENSKKLNDLQNMAEIQEVSMKYMVLISSH